MKRSIDVSSDEAQKHFLKGSSYFNGDFPSYISFETILKDVGQVLGGGSYTGFKEQNPGSFPDRPFERVRDEQEDHQWNEIYFLFGQATLRAQAHEDGMARFIVTAEEEWHRSGKSVEAIERMPLGALQKEYARYCLLEACHRERMENARRTRNSLAHNFYRCRRHLLESQQGRTQVIRELYEAAELFQQERDDVYWALSLLTGQPPR